MKYHIINNGTSKKTQYFVNQKQMDKVNKWVAKYEKKPCPQTVAYAKTELDPTRFYKFIEITGYVSVHPRKPKCKRRLEIEAMDIGAVTPIETLWKDKNYIYAINYEGEKMYLVENRKTIKRVK